jgi:diguanylate cyclase (GGDEF)-like protein
MSEKDDRDISSQYCNENDRLMACLEIGKRLTSSLNLKEILEHIMKKISLMIRAGNWSLLVKDPDTGELTFEIVKGVDSDSLTGMKLPPGGSIASHVAETGKPLFLSDVKKDPRFNSKVDEQTGFSTQSLICIPLKIYGQTLGVIEIVNVEDMSDFEIRELPVLQVLADYAAIAIQNSRNFERVQKMSITDEYTGLYNARHLHETLDDVFRVSENKGKEFAIVFVDIDNFKNLVDEYGHLSGSQILKEIGETVTSCLIEEDMLFKYGGDEYVMIFPDTDRKSAIERLNKIMDAIKASTYLETESKPVSITASFGMAMYPEDATNKKELLLRADHSMYKIKKTTKNGLGTAS